MAKYESTLAPALRQWVEMLIEYYPENKRRLQLLKNSMIPSAIPKYGPQAGGGDSEARPTEEVAVKIVSDRYLLNLEMTVGAISSVYDQLGELDRELLRLRFWDGNLTPDGIALRLNVSRTTFYIHLNSILVEVARRIGYIDL